MHTVPFRDFDDCRRVARTLLLQEELHANLALTLLYHRDGNETEGNGALAVGVFEGEQLLGVGLRGRGAHAVVFSPLPTQAVRVLWEAFRGARPSSTDFVGTVAQMEALAFAARAAPARVRTYGLYATTEPSLPSPVDGESRAARPEDEPLLIHWAEEFARELDAPLSPQYRTDVRRRIADGSYLLWTENDVPVSQCFTELPIEHGIRINAVYTPKSLRGRGYAPALVASHADLLLAKGFGTVLLYSDRSNTTANAMYRRAGFSPVVDLCHVRFAAPHLSGAPRS